MTEDKASWAGLTDLGPNRLKNMHKSFETLVLEGYASAADGLITPYDAIDNNALFAPGPPYVSRLRSKGYRHWRRDGRDARWLADQGHDVTAVEPVAAFRASGQSWGVSCIQWIDDQLPLLRRVPDAGYRFGLLNGVWHHLSEPARKQAMPNIARVLAPNGTVVLSLRLGPGVAGRPAMPICVDNTIVLAERSGLELVNRVDTESIQPGNRWAGVTWSWLRLRRVSGDK